MRRSDVAAASNARIVPVVEYAGDSRGRSMFARLAGAHARGMTGRETTSPPVVERNGWWHGRIHASPQRFHGLANLGVGAVGAVVERNAELTDVRSAGLENAAQRLFRSQAERRRR